MTLGENGVGCGPGHSAGTGSAAQSSPPEQGRGGDAGLSQGGGDHGRSAGRLGGVAAAGRLINYPRAVDEPGPAWPAGANFDTSDVSDLPSDRRPRKVCSKHPEAAAMQAYLKAVAIMAGLLGTWVALLPLVA